MLQGLRNVAVCVNTTQQVKRQKGILSDNLILGTIIVNLLDKILKLLPDILSKGTCTGIRPYE